VEKQKNLANSTSKTRVLAQPDGVTISIHNIRITSNFSEVYDLVWLLMPLGTMQMGEGGGGGGGVENSFKTASISS